VAHIKRTIEITADRQAVWSVLADLGDVTHWNPNICAVELQEGQEPGVGTLRTCHLTSGGHIDETIAIWEPGQRLQFAIGSHGGIRSADMAMQLTATAAGTQVEAIADYHVAFGPLGPVIDRLAVKRQMARMLDAGLAGLKEHVENQHQQERQCHD